MGLLPHLENDDLTGIINLFDFIQDELEDKHGVPANKIFRFLDNTSKNLNEYNQKLERIKTHLKIFI